MASDKVFWMVLLAKVGVFEWWVSSTARYPEASPAEDFPRQARDFSGGSLFASESWIEGQRFVVPEITTGPANHGILVDPILLKTCVPLTIDEGVWRPTCPVIQRQPRIEIPAVVSMSEAGSLSPGATPGDPQSPSTPVLFFALLALLSLVFPVLAIWHTFAKADCDHDGQSRDLADKVKEQEATIAGLEDRLRGTEMVEEQLAKCSAQLAEDSKAMGQMHELVEKQKAMLEKKSSLIKEQETTMAQQMELVSEQAAKMAEKDSTIAELRAAMAQQTAVVTEQAAKLAEKSSLIKEQRSALAKKEEEIEEQVALMVEQDSTIKEQEALMVGQGSEIEELREVLRQKENELKEEEGATARVEEEREAERKAAAEHASALASTRDRLTKQLEEANKELRAATFFDKDLSRRREEMMVKLNKRLHQHTRHIIELKAQIEGLGQVPVSPPVVGDTTPAPAPTSEEPDAATPAPSTPAPAPSAPTPGRQLTDSRWADATPPSGPAALRAGVQGRGRGRGRGGH
ncbi:hypothetical protein AYL99_09194 [Fonsecaea erecta]|uniref:Uncharacterized protein n=1 Tax=Fonsecaea erecta TaxID=1367422 RepID=A0A178ZC76_9EURO|nr:hypothetical protein AYL99_09194 [Fonsecaea erecta]OAP57081.1 hypothetical protein AYL99_09194 [Fonsecaea erecta]